jgi:hypothetical protein
VVQGASPSRADCIGLYPSLNWPGVSRITGFEERGCGDDDDRRDAGQCEALARAPIVAPRINVEEQEAMNTRTGFTGGLGIALVVLGVACGGGTTSASGAGAMGGGGGSGSVGGGGDECTAKIVVDLYGDDQCTEPARFSYTLDLAKSCSGWSRQKGTTTMTDSASRFQCYRDRVCYTQYVATETCDAQASKLITDKESRTSCMKDDTPNIWTKIRSGTETCPEAGAGFECPTSNPGEGTRDLAATCSGS